MQQLQTRTLVGSKHRELREESWKGFPPWPPLRIFCTGTGKHSCQMVTTAGRGHNWWSCYWRLWDSRQRLLKNKTIFVIVDTQSNKKCKFSGKQSFAFFSSCDTCFCLIEPCSVLCFCQGLWHIFYLPFLGKYANAWKDIKSSVWQCHYDFFELRVWDRKKCVLFMCLLLFSI